MTHSVRAVDPSVYTRRRVLVATAVALPIVALRKFGTGDATSNEARSAAPTASPPVAAAAPRSAATSNDSATVPPTTALEFDHDVGPGSTGAKVGALQNRLIEIGFDPGPADSVFGPATERAVWAFEKFILDTPPGGVTGVVTAGMWARLNEPIAVRPGVQVLAHTWRYFSLNKSPSFTTTTRQRSSLTSRADPAKTGATS